MGSCSAFDRLSRHARPTRVAFAGKYWPRSLCPDTTAEEISREGAGHEGVIGQMGTRLAD